MMRSLAEGRNGCLIAIAVPLAVIARLDRAIQYAETAVIETIGRGVLDAPPSRGMTPGVEAYAAPIKIPTASTIAPPSTIWNTAWRNGVSM
ncbi:hypothetical protein ABIB90_001338 [Bradyrhizobium sp. JR4.1]